MKYLCTATLVFWFFGVTAQVRIDRVMIQVNAGVGISNKPATMFGAPFFLSSELAFSFTNKWRIVAETGGVSGFRDLEHPNQKIGLVVGSYSRCEHGYIGLRVGRNLLNTAQKGQLFLSSGADYLAVTEPNVKRSTGFLGGLYYDYRIKRYLNIPLQLDYSTRPLGGKDAQITLSGRWNFNPYHSFPTISVGLGVPLYRR